MKTLILAACALAITGCQSPPRPPDLRPPLVQKLHQRGVTDATTARIILVGSEGGYGSDTQVVITADFLIREIWDTIHQSRPHNAWVASGYRKLQFHTDARSAAPAAELLVNATDRCHFDDDSDDAFRCPGINNILEPLVKANYENDNRR